MELTEKLSQLYDWIEPLVVAHDCVIYHIDYFKEGQQWFLEILLTRTNGDGADLERVTEISRQVSALVDEKQWSTDDYYLDVSSAGAERPLYSIEQVIAAQGSYVAVILKTPLEKDTQWMGYLRTANEEEITLECRVKTKTITLTIPYTNIDFIRHSVIY